MFTGARDKLDNVTQLKPAVLAVEAYYLTHFASQ